MQHRPFHVHNTKRPADNTSKSSHPTNPDNRQCRHTIDSTKHSPAYRPHIPADCDMIGRPSTRGIVRSQSTCGSDPAIDCRNPARMPDSTPGKWAGPLALVECAERTEAARGGTQSRTPGGSIRHRRAPGRRSDRRSLRQCLHDPGDSDTRSRYSQCSCSRAGEEVGTCEVVVEAGQQFGQRSGLSGRLWRYLRREERLPFRDHRQVDPKPRRSVSLPDRE